MCKYCGHFLLFGRIIGLSMDDEDFVRAPRQGSTLFYHIVHIWPNFLKPAFLSNSKWLMTHLFFDPQFRGLVLCFRLFDRKIDESQSIWLIYSESIIERILAFWENMEQLYEEYEKAHKDNLRNFIPWFLIWFIDTTLGFNLSSE